MHALPLFYMHAHANQRKCYLWHNWHTNILYTSHARLFFLLLKCFPVLLSHRVYFPVFTIKPEDTIWSIKRVCALVLVESHKLKIPGQAEIKTCWGNYWYFHLYLYFHFPLYLYLYLKTQGDQLSLCALMWLLLTRACEVLTTMMINDCISHPGRRRISYSYVTVSYHNLMY